MLIKTDGASLKYDIDNVGFVGSRIIEDYTAMCILENEEKIKRKIYFWAANSGFLSSINIDDLFLEFLSKFIEKDNYSYRYDYNEDPEYDVYTYIIARLNFFFKFKTRETVKKLNKELRIYEDKIEEGDKVPTGHVSINVIESINTDNIEAIIDQDNLDNIMDGLAYFSAEYDFPILDYFIIKYYEQVTSKKLKRADLNCALNTMNTSKMEDFFKSDSRDAKEIHKCVLEFFKICRNCSLDVLKFTKINLDRISF